MPGGTWLKTQVFLSTEYCITGIGSISLLVNVAECFVSGIFHGLFSLFLLSIHLRALYICGSSFLEQISTNRVSEMKDLNILCSQRFCLIVLQWNFISVDLLKFRLLILSLPLDIFNHFSVLPTQSHNLSEPLFNL